MSSNLQLLEYVYSRLNSWPGMWDISAAGHVTEMDGSVDTALRETFEELGVDLTPDCLELIFIYCQESTDNGGLFINNEVFMHK